MICSRCQGLMWPVELRDWAGGRGHDCSNAWRCVMCGEIVDPVIRSNRMRTKEGGLHKRMKQARDTVRTIPV